MALDCLIVFIYLLLIDVFLCGIRNRRPNSCEKKYVPRVVLPARVELILEVRFENL